MRDFRECQAFVVHLQHEHKQIRQAIGDVKRELDSEDPASEPARMGDGLRGLRDLLVEHFKEEERGGCLEEAVSCVPRLSADVAEIEKEHVSILNQIDRLIERSRDCDTDAFRESFREFAMNVHAHESAENRILQTAFGTGEFDHNATPPAYGEI